MRKTGIKIMNIEGELINSVEDWFRFSPPKKKDNGKTVVAQKN